MRVKLFCSIKLEDMIVEREIKGWYKYVPPFLGGEIIETNLQGKPDFGEKCTGIAQLILI
ncbi:hypothetical protein FOA20_05320 [Peribacillus simplex]